MVSPPWPAELGVPDVGAARNSFFLPVETALPPNLRDHAPAPRPHGPRLASVSQLTALSPRPPVHRDQREAFALWPTFPAGPGSTAARGTGERVTRCAEPLWFTPQFLPGPGELKPVSPLWGAGWLPWMHLPLSLSAATCLFPGWGWPCWAEFRPQMWSLPPWWGGPRGTEGGPALYPQPQSR